MFGRFSFKAMKIASCTVCIHCKYHSIFMMYLQCKDLINLVDIPIKSQFPVPQVQSVLSLLKGLMPG
ncbi:hypothetical protein JZ09_21225 [Salmonella enterica]|nr:hypothetical protein [Salmonella enterica]EBV6531225.1 hypothetical protein [Salmonella enterica subsp. enterica serovar Oranienburg]EED3792885.1 hypothetical protein [Salmonella enterica subsp. enterica serovar Oranienburg]